LEFRGEGENEVGVVVRNEKNFTNVKVGHELIKIDPSYFRPAEVDTLIGDASNARKKLGWSHTTSLQELVVEMVAKDLQNQEMTTHPSMNTPD
jgi:GDPmannose 4,6-dehydratase